MKILSILLLSSICIPISKAQEFSGLATYKTSGAIKIEMDSTQMPPGQMQEIQKQLQRKLQKEYTLAFNTTESTWKQVETLDGGTASAPGNGFELMVAGNSPREILYKNLKTNAYEKGSDLMGKRFIVKDSLKKYDWKLINETKKIGRYNCQKAIHTKITDAKIFSTNMDEMEITKDTVTTIAWFTTDIPVSHGPMEFHGLPGLILEVNTGYSVVICTKVALGPQENIEITRPKKGKVVSSEEYKAIKEEKMEDMMKRYNGGDGKKTIEIRIGG